MTPVMDFGAELWAPLDDHPAYEPTTLPVMSTRANAFEAVRLQFRLQLARLLNDGDAVKAPRRRRKDLPAQHYGRPF